MKKIPLLLVSITALSLPLLTSVVMAQQAPTPVSTVQVAEVQKVFFTPTIDLVGTVFSQNNVVLTAGVNGRLDYVAEPGTYLLKGEDVARVNQLPLKLQQAEQKAVIKRAAINQQYLERELQRLQELRETNNTSAFQYDQTRSQLELAQADLEIAELRLQQIEDQLSRTVIKAPFDGVVTERQREAGGEINRSDALVSMLDTENLEGRIFVPVKYLPFLRHVKNVSVKNDNAETDADIKAIIPAADVRSQSFELRVSLPFSEQASWTSGQLFKASLPIQKPQEALTVHRDALILRENATYVVVIDRENKAQRREVVVGEGHEEWVSVTGANLQQGERVATRGAERLSDGQLVAISEPTA